VSPLVRFARSLSPVVASFLVLALTHGPAAAARYICPPCGAPCDTMSFSAPGVCPACGMTLVDAASVAARPAPDPNRKRVAILVFSGVEIIDFAGPYEMFGAAGCDVYTVAATRDPLTTSMGLTVVPQYTFADAPRPDVLVVPGGAVHGASTSEPTLRYVREVTGQDQTTMSVCNGAFILASAGMLDGLSATTTNGNLDRLASEHPRIKVVRDQRYVDNGKIVTAAGLAAGIDGALHVISKLYGPGVAQGVALGEEYEWKQGGGFVRAALADQQLPEIDLDSTGKWTVVRTEGDRTKWDIVAEGHTTDLTAADLMGRIEKALVQSHWTKQGSMGPGATAHSSRWRFTGKDGRPWTGTLKVESASASSHDLTASLSIARAS
jgi:putative intracellular protease/amidase